MSFRHADALSLAALVGLVGLATALAPGVLAQNFSPYFETTGRGAYDLYNDAVACSALLEGQSAHRTRGEDRAQLKTGAREARDLALFLLGSGTVVDESGAVLAPDNLSIDLRNARSDWVAVLLSIEDEGGTPEAETARCLSLYAPSGAELRR